MDSKITICNFALRFKDIYAEEFLYVTIFAGCLHSMKNQFTC